MSFQATAWAVEQRVGDPTAKLLLLTIAEAADIEHAECWPAVSTLARRIEASESTTKRKLALLESRGLLRITQRRLPGGRSQTNIYTLKVGVQVEPHPGGEGFTALNPGGVHSSDRGEGFTALNPKQSKDEKVREKDSPAEPASPKAEHPTQVFIRLWHEAFEQTFGDAYVMTGGKDGVAAKQLLRSTELSPEDLMEVARAAWASKGDRRRCFHCSSAMTIAGFRSAFVSIREELQSAGKVLRRPAQEQEVKGGVSVVA